MAKQQANHAFAPRAVSQVMGTVASGGGEDAAVLREDLRQVTALYEESLCVWEHEIGLLQARLARAGNMAGEVARLRVVGNEALRASLQKDAEIAHLSARVEHLRRENEDLARKVCLPPVLLDADGRAASPVCGTLSRVLHTIMRWASVPRRNRER